MKITAIETFILRAEIPRQVTDAFNSAVMWGLPGVLIRTDEGLVGTGYTSTLSHGDEAIVDVIERYYAPLLIGQDPWDTERHWERMFW